ncbi:hypothetical protein GQ600_7204 [Phytophthora cactorum]|nr:hypothetical protein GQ600_7204 [Phytophthora cactorum]
MTLSPLLLVLLATAQRSPRPNVRESGQRAGLRRVYPRGDKEPADPETMTGDGWPSVIGAATVQPPPTATRRVCRKDGMAAGRTAISSSSNAPLQRQRCCSWQQNQAMAENFKLLASVFAQNSAGGSVQHMAHEWPSTNYRQDPMTGKEGQGVGAECGSSQGDDLCIFDFLQEHGHGVHGGGNEVVARVLNYQMQAGQWDKSFDHDVLKCSNYSEVVETRETLPTQAQLLGIYRSKSTDDKHHIHVVDDPISVFSGFNTKIVAAAYGLLRDSSVFLEQMEEPLSAIYDLGRHFFM